MASSRRLLPSLCLSVIGVLIAIACILAQASARRGCPGSFTAFSFPDFTKDVQSFSLLHDARVTDSGIQISGSQPRSVGALFYSKPVRFLQPFRFPHPVSFACFFSFSMAAGEGDGLAFVIMPRKDFVGANGPWLGLEPSSDFPPLAHTVAVEFDTAMNAEVEDSSENHVGLDVESLVSLATANVTDGLRLNDGDRWYAWIDYRAPVKVVEVRLSKSQSQRPESPILSHSIDLSTVLREEMFVGFVSSTGNEPQRHMIYSWSFATSDPGMRPGWGGPHSWHRDSWFHHSHGYGHDHPRYYHHPHPGFADNWHQHPRPDQWHQASIHQDEESGFWFDNLSDVWRIIISLLFGIVCGSTAAACMFVIWIFVRRWWMTASGKQDDVGILYGYQKLTNSDQAQQKTDPNGYQEIPTTEPEEDNTQSA